MKILALSPFVKNQFDKNPNLYELLDKELDLSQDWLDFQQKNNHMDTFALSRKYRQSRLALVAAQDLNNTNPESHIHTLKQTSALAKLLIVFAYEQAREEIELKFGQVIDLSIVDSREQKQSLLIFALGKLGGNELNYSSDVDLVFCYSGNGQSNGKKHLDAQRYFNRLGRRIIQILDSVTSDGIVYRVDMRLRPFGSAAPLTCSVNNLLAYLESEGRDWERYAWLRASVVVGNQELACKTLKSIEPFIYRKYLDYSIFESLRQIKAQIQREQTDDQDNLKLGYGGIREIEFIIQTLQITFGGRNKQLRGNDLWQQIHTLCEFKHISVKDLQHLRDAWLLLRKLENLCQIIADRDTHHLPNDTQQLASCMGFDNSAELLKNLNNHRTCVHRIFDQLFLSNQAKTNSNAAHPQIQCIKDKISQRKYPKSVKHKIYAALDALCPLLVRFNNQEHIIQCYWQVVNAVSKRQSYLSMLVESPLILQKLVTQIAHSSYFSNCIAKTPSLLELLFDGLDVKDFIFKEQWQIFSQKHKINDAEIRLELLSQFRGRIQFKAVMAYVDEIHDARKTSIILSDLAQFILAEVIKLSWGETQARIKSNIKVDDLIVIAYGSLAMKTMHIKSDFDLVFVFTNEINDDNHKFVRLWIRRIIHFLSIESYSGSLYQLDTQLRPNGKSGAVIVSQTNFESYQKNQAWTWEHAALIKTRTVYATVKQTQWFDQLRKEILTKKRESIEVKKDLAKMTKKMQELDKSHQSEFLQLSDILINAYKHPEIIAVQEIEISQIKDQLNHSITQ